MKIRACLLIFAKGRSVHGDVSIGDSLRWCSWVGGRDCRGAGESWVFVRLVRGRRGGVVPAGGAIIMQLIRLNFEC